MGHAGQLDVAGVDRFAADLFDGVDAMRIGADDCEIPISLHGVSRKKATVSSSPWPKTAGYLRIFGLSFSGKYLSQKGQ